MTAQGVEQGNELAEHAKANAGTYSVQYIIWQQRIYNVDRASAGWRLMEDRGSATANHRDHVHITFKDNGDSSVCDSDPGDQGENCVGKDISWNPVSWVLVPTKCALDWAFSPDPDVLNDASAGLNSAWDDSSLGAWSAALPTFWEEIAAATGADTGTALAPPAKSVSFIGPSIADDGGGSGGTGGAMPQQPANAESCQGPGLPTGALGRAGRWWTDPPLPAQLHPFSACNAPVSYAADVSWALSTLTISFYGGLRIVRVLGSGFGWIVPVPDAPRGDDK